MRAIALIVGVHFFGLAHAMISGGGRVFVWVGGVMCIFAVAVIFGLARSFLSARQSMALIGFGCAVVLWASALTSLT